MCHEIKGTKNPREPWGTACVRHDGRLFEPSHHWLTHDPEDHGGEGRPSHQTCLRSPQGDFYHFHCAPEGIWDRFQVLDADEAEAESEAQP